MPRNVYKKNSLTSLRSLKQNLSNRTSMFNRQQFLIVPYCRAKKLYVDDISYTNESLFLRKLLQQCKEILFFNFLNVLGCKEELHVLLSCLLSIIRHTFPSIIGAKTVVFRLSLDGSSLQKDTQPWKLLSYSVLTTYCSCT